MKRISRRAVLKGGLAMPVVAAVGLPEMETTVAAKLPASNLQNVKCSEIRLPVSLLRSICL